MKKLVDLYHDCNGEIWGLIAFGHGIDNKTFLSEANEILADEDCEPANDSDIERLWAYDEDDTDFPTFICEKEDQNSFPVTVILEKNIKYKN